MKRSLVSSLVLSLALAGCGAPEDGAVVTGPGGLAMEGPDADGNFYVVGFAGAAAAQESVTLVNHEGRRVEVVADADGSFAAMLWSSMDKPIEVQTQGAVAMAATSEPQKINVNYASRTGLEAVPGIGATLAGRILAYRADVGLFSEVDDLVAVDGIGPVSVEKLRPYVETKIDINVATKAQLQVLPNIGAAKASAIIAWRNANGPFSSISDLLLVEGIKPADYEAVKPYVKAGEVSTHPGAALVNVNEAGIEALITLPGIGEGKAKAIVDYRQNHGLFYTKDDLLHVPGIGPTTLANIRDLVTVGVLDAKVGTFVADGAWQYTAGGAQSGASFPKAVLVKFEHSLSANELLVTFVGGGYCDGVGDCAPFTLKGTVLGETVQGIRYRLSGLMPAQGGSFSIAGTSDDEGLLTQTGATIAFKATRAGESYRVALSGYRVLE